MIKRIKKSEGFSLVEVIIYVAILGIIIAFVTSFLSDIFKTYNKAQAKKAVSSNITTVLGSISNEIKYTKSIYVPTSVLSSDFGQLSLETELSPQPDHTSTFVDFYLDNGVIYEKRENTASLPLTSDRVFITKLKFERFTSSALGKDIIKTTIDGRINTVATQPEYQATISLTSSDSLRGAY